MERETYLSGQREIENTSCNLSFGQGIDVFASRLIPKEA
jgi:hypothetical protein